MRGRKAPKPDAASLCGAILLALSGQIFLSDNLAPFFPAAAAAVLKYGAGTGANLFCLLGPEGCGTLRIFCRRCFNAHY